MSLELPPLPVAHHGINPEHVKYTSDQMRFYARAAQRMALLQAAEMAAQAPFNTSSERLLRKLAEGL